MHTTYDNVLQLIEFNFTKLLATANRDALLYFLDWMNSVSSNIENMQKQYNHPTEKKRCPSPKKILKKIKKKHCTYNLLSSPAITEPKVQQCMYINFN